MGLDTVRRSCSELAMSAQHWLQRELRLLYEYGEHDTFTKDAQRILTGLAAYSSTPKVSLTDALDQAGVEYATIRIDNDVD